MEEMTLARALAFVASAGLLLLSSCGPQGPTVDLKLVTGLENHGPKNLLNGLVGIGSYPDSCRQKNLYAVVVAENDREGAFELFRVPIETGMSATTPMMDAAWVTQNSLSPPIVVPVPRGVEVSVGVVGSLSWSRRKDANGETCADFDGDSMTAAPYSTSSVIGHRTVIASAQTEVPLKVWVLPAQSPPKATPTPGDPNCALGRDAGQLCPSQDFFRFNCPNCGGTHLQFEYAIDRLQPDKRVIQWVPSAGAAANLYLPNVLPMKVTLYDNATRANYGSVVFRKDLFAPATGGNRAATITLPGYSLTLTEFADKVPPVIPLFAMTSIKQDGDDILLEWNLPANATRFDVRIGGTAFATAYSSPYRIVGALINSFGGAGPFSPGTNHTFDVVASNNQGSAPVAGSPAATINPLGPFGVQPSYNGSGTANTLSIYCGNHSMATAMIARGVKTGGSGPATMSIACTSGGNAVFTAGLVTGATYDITVEANNGGSNGQRFSNTFSGTVY